VPPARDRAEDIPQIATAMLDALSVAEGRSFRRLSPEVAEIFRRHTWPGNLRELENVIRTVVLLNEAEVVTPDMLPPGLRPTRAQPVSPLDDMLGRPLADIERQVIEAVIARQGGSIPRAARSLDISPSTIYRKIEAWDRNGTAAETSPGTGTPGPG
jgi:transcriptional regulator with PAS, ATPase and Fis domain